MELKLLRKAVLVATNHIKDEDDGIDKSMKKLFKSAVQSLENGELFVVLKSITSTIGVLNHFIALPHKPADRLSLSADGIVKLSKSERSKKSNEEDDDRSSKKKSKDKKKKKRKADDDMDEAKTSKQAKKQESKESEQEAVSHDSENEEDSNSNEDNNGTEDLNNEQDEADKNKPCKGNPSGITRLFLGNLPFAITDSTLNDHLNSTITHIKWITDKETGKFYGSAFCEVRNSRDAAKAVTEMNGSKVMGRPIKINYAPIKPGQEGDWPPKQRVITGGKVANNGGQAGGQGVKAMSVKPEGCCKLFIGNLSYDLDDDGITKFFMAVDAEIKAVRWLYHRDSGDFKGCGYVDFWSTEACEKAAALNGKNLLGRPIRIDWAE